MPPKPANPSPPSVFLTMHEAVNETKLLALTMQYASQAPPQPASVFSKRGAFRYRAKAARAIRVRTNTEMLSSLWLVSSISLTLAVILPSCSATPQSESPLFGTGIFHPPPKPGASISQTRMCECVACAPRDCCAGGEDEEATATCVSSADSSEQSLCPDSIRSCTSRCAREVWRVKVGEECASKRPTSCCRAG